MPWALQHNPAYLSQSVYVAGKYIFTVPADIMRQGMSADSLPCPIPGYKTTMDNAKMPQIRRKT
jgi:hypothetical protein